MLLVCSAHMDHRNRVTHAHTPPRALSYCSFCPMEILPITWHHSNSLFFFKIFFFLCGPFLYLHLLVLLVYSFLKNFKFFPDLCHLSFHNSDLCWLLPPSCFISFLNAFQLIWTWVTVLNCSKATSFWHVFFRNVVCSLFSFYIKTLYGI